MTVSQITVVLWGGTRYRRTNTLSQSQTRGIGAQHPNPIFFSSHGNNELIDSELNHIR
jgi:uracil DNA glycosylase